MNTSKSVNEYISELKNENKKVRYTAYLMIAVLVMVLAVSVLKQFYLTLALLVAALFLQLFVFRRFQKDYVRNCENANISLTTLKKINASEIKEKGTSVDESMVKSAHIFPFVEKTFAAFKSIKGSKDNTVISSSDITVVERKNDKGIAAEVSTGNWSHLELPKTTGIKAVIVEDELMSEAARKSFFDVSGYKEAELPEGFPKRFHLYITSCKSGDNEAAGAASDGSDDTAKSSGLPSDSFLNKVKALSDYTPGKIGVSVSENTVDVFIKNRFLAAGFSSKYEPDEKTLMRDPYPELTHIAELAQYL